MPGVGCAEINPPRRVFYTDVPGGFYQLWFAVRYTHVAAGAVLIGGAVLLSIRADALAATAYEWLFWIVVAVSTATGISNLGLKGAGLLPAVTSWGAALSVKLISALLMLAFGVVRTDIVLAFDASADEPPRLLRWLYAATAAGLLAMLWLGLGLAHGRY